MEKSRSGTQLDGKTILPFLFSSKACIAGDLFDETDQAGAPMGTTLMSFLFTNS